MSQKQVLVYQGQKFAAESGSGRFAKDVLGVGKWYHPITKREVPMPAERIERLAAATQKYHNVGNKIPFRDGHKNSVLANMGEWNGPFIKHGEKLVAVVEPKDPKAIAGCRNGSIDGVSVVIEFDHTDSLKNHYDEVITAIDATDFPVITGQSEFVELSRDAEGNEVFYPESLMLASDPSAGDCMAQHDALHADLKSKVADFGKKKAKLGADHADTKTAGSKAQEAAMRLRKQAQVVHDHVSNMTGGPAYYDRREKPTVAEAFQELAQGVNPDKVAQALLSLKNGN